MESPGGLEAQRAPSKGWKCIFGRKSSIIDDKDLDAGRPAKWSMGVLNDKQTIEVPGALRMKEISFRVNQI
jgi:hypothetical protein